MVRPPKTIKAAKAALRKCFNLYIRMRDFPRGCISCPNFKRHKWGAGFQAGHFYTSASSHAAFDFDELNVHGQCSYCNMNEGSAQNYERGLIRRYGPDIIAKIEERHTASLRIHWGLYDYIEKIVYYKARVSELSLQRK